MKSYKNPNSNKEQQKNSIIVVKGRLKNVYYCIFLQPLFKVCMLTVL